MTTDARHDWSIVPNRARGLQLTDIDQLWVADITYVHLAEEFAFLAIVLDAFSRKVIGWAIPRRDSTTETELRRPSAVCQARAFGTDCA
ncbi:DDE-type integrase/transposase/recombinase [Mesorhizobium sp. M1D.F.Ca.ET.234.01.1.1]|uniref:DDE-type integrase/transposase/recombinase n=1 Tax=Mesorhizobium sp. M1D.F.Ca.ET.234.01.1.1 TaxID=2563932 RepID=UPI002479A815|nr:DDE-type integrase/transposase/recombinase [Mesorhizobium sp. M1D.F.Ca.ET.234.01.1.1]